MHNFSSSKIHVYIIKALADQNIFIPTEIQAKSIPVLLTHNGDFIGRSATGTGKTFAYGTVLLSKIYITKCTIQAVVLVPTRELCEQVGNELSGLARYIPALKI